MAKKKKQQVSIRGHHFDIKGVLQGIDDKISVLDPLASTMSKALTQVGIKPPNELADLSQSFHDNIVAPVSSSIENQSVGDTIINFFKEQMTAKNNGQKLPPVLNTVANGGNGAVARLQAEKFFTDLFSNPFVLIGLVVVIGTIIYLARK